MGSSQPGIEQSILRTLAYYDVHDYPLTTEQIWRWFWAGDGQLGMGHGAISFQDVQAAVAELIKQKKLEQAGDYLVLPGRAELVTLRQDRARENERKWRRAVTTAKYLQIIPFVKMVAVVNTLAIDNARPDSDIDLLIVTSPQHIWLARMMVTGVVSLLGYRRHKDKIANRVCLSFYLTTEALNLEPLKAEPEDFHFAMWASQAVPLLDDGTYQKFVAANGWVTQMLPNGWSWDWKSKLVAPQTGLIGIKQFYQAAFSSPIGVWLENWARQRQLKKMEKNTESKASQPTTDVIISEDVLKFHEADRRFEYNRKFRDKLRDLGIETPTR